MSSLCTPKGHIEQDPAHQSITELATSSALSSAQVTQALPKKINGGCRNMEHTALSLFTFSLNDSIRFQPT